MRAIIRQQFGGPEQLVIQEVPIPEPQLGQVLIEVKAFGLNHAETYMRRGLWGDVVNVSGIECVGVVKSDPARKLAPGQKVAAMMGGMGRTISGSYAEYTCVPSSNVVPLKTDLSWDQLAAVPEVYSTAWTCLFGNLDLKAGQRLLVRGATSALGQAAVNIAAYAGAEVIATTRNRERFSKLQSLGTKHTELESPDLSRRIRAAYPGGIDAVLELVGNSTLLDSLATLRRGGKLVLAGFLGGLDPIASFNPLLQLPSGVHFSFFGSFAYGTPEFPLNEVPLQTIVDRAAAGIYKTKPARVFPFEQIQEAHRLMDSNQANGKIVMTLNGTQD